VHRGYSFQRSYTDLYYYRVRAPAEAMFEENVGGGGCSGVVDLVFEYTPVNPAMRGFNDYKTSMTTYRGTSLIRNCLLLGS